MLVNSAQKNKCQTHTLRCYAPRCISDSIAVDLIRDRVHLYPSPSGHRIGRRKDGVPHTMPLHVWKRAFGS